MGEVESLEAHYSDLRHKLNTGAIKWKWADDGMAYASPVR